jgi:muramoyltetrapeptide carboxypeptidase
VPILGGLPIGHGPEPDTIPLGATATIGVAAGALTIQTGVA